MVGGAGGRTRSLAARIVAKQEFAGYWEYVLDEAIFTAPAHPNWGGTALIGPSGELLGIGSLQLERAREGRKSEHLNMIVPIDLLKPILDDLHDSAASTGRRGRGSASTPPRSRTRSWSSALRPRAGGARRNQNRRRGAGGRGREVASLAAFYRKVWSLGQAGVEVPLTIYRDGRHLRRAGEFIRPRRSSSRRRECIRRGLGPCGVSGLSLSFIGG